MKQYDERRDKKLPSAKWIYKLCGFTSWNELLKACGFRLHRDLSNESVNFQVEVRYAYENEPYEIRIAKWDRLNKELIDLVNEIKKGRQKKKKIINNILN